MHQLQLALPNFYACMAEEIKESILVAGRDLGYPSIKQEQARPQHFFEWKDVL